MKTLVAIAAFCALCVACGPNTIAENSSTSSAGVNNEPTTQGNTFVIPKNPNVPASTTVTHTAQNFTAADAQFLQLGVANGIAGFDGLIIISSTPNLCADTGASTYHVGEIQIVFTLEDLPDGNGPLASQTYVYPATTTSQYEIANATYAVVDAPCTYNAQNLVSGSVTVTGANSSTISGTYTLTFPTGTVTGSFNSLPTCPALNTTPNNPVCN